MIFKRVEMMMMIY